MKNSTKIHALAPKINYTWCKRKIIKNTKHTSVWANSNCILCLKAGLKDMPHSFILKDILQNIKFNKDMENLLS